MRPWYKYSERTDDYQSSLIITPFSKIWGFGAPVTVRLIIANAAIWFLMGFTDSLKLLDLHEFWYTIFGMTPSMVYSGHVYQVLTNIFLHSGEDILHLLFNMYLLWIFGPRVERIFSSRMFFAFYLVAGIVGSLLSLLMRTIPGDPIMLNSPSLGASGAVFGILVAYGFLFSKEKLLLFFFIPIEAWKAVVGFIVMESLFVIFNLMANVDHWAHLGGAAAAAIWMLILIKKTGNKTEHGWHHGGRQGRTVDGFWVDPSHARSSKKGFKVIFGKTPKQHSEHPEGTDDEPPPEWFDLKS